MTSRFFRFLSKRGPKSQPSTSLTTNNGSILNNNTNTNHHANQSLQQQQNQHASTDNGGGNNNSKHVKLNGCEDLKESIEHYNQRCLAIKQLKEKEEQDRLLQQQQTHKNKIPQSLVAQNGGNANGGGGFLSFKSFKQKNKSSHNNQNQLQQQQQIAKDSIECAVIFLDDAQENFVLPKKALAAKLYEQVYYHLDLIETDYFGLQFSDTHNVKHWLDPTKPIKKQCKIGPPYQFFFKVRIQIYFSISMNKI